MAPSTDFSGRDCVSEGGTYDSSNLAGKSVLITGAANGLGEEFMRAFVKAGAFVTFGDVDRERGSHLASELGTRVAFEHCDVLTWTDQLRLFNIALQKSPARSVDIVIANAGIASQDPLSDDTTGPDGEPVEPDLKILRTNLLGVAYTVKLALHYLSRQPEGEDRDRCLILTDSISGYVDQPGELQYNASKWAVRGLMRSLRRTMPGRGMRVNTIAPWFIRTHIMSESTIEQLISAGIELADISDAVEAVLHLASDQTLNGRSLAIVPKSFNSNGYVDLRDDDRHQSALLRELQKCVPGAV